MGEYKDKNNYKFFGFFIALILFLSNINFIFADRHLTIIESLESENYSVNIYFPSDPKVGYLDLEIEFREVPQEIKLLLIANLHDEKFQTYALSSNQEPKIYKCVFDLEKSGLWNFDMFITNSYGKEENISFQINLLDRNRETSPFSISFYLFSIIFLAIFLGPLYIFRKNIFKQTEVKK